ncbi:MAG: hypothetical protein BWY68_00296 [bacterium ADurb.Bin400]|nr:MAG: hypothetical protein BWY68_00296 [bacterium ADurb.Bin400]
MARSLTEKFYQEVLQILAQSKQSFLVGGTYALNEYTGMDRATKDLDIFTTAGNYLKIISHFHGKNYKTEILDARWLAQIKRGSAYVDVIFSSVHGVMPITEEWFSDTTKACMYGVNVRLPSPTFLIWSKILMQSRAKYDGPDVAHLILTQSQRINWQQLLSRLEPYWEVLLAQLINFRFIYPSERAMVPDWLMQELVDRLQRQMELPVPKDRVSRGQLLSRQDYLVDSEKFGFKGITE